MAGHEKARQVAHDLEGVFVYGIDMKQIVLHLADNAAEGGNIPRQDIEGIQVSQSLGHAIILAQDLQEEITVLRLLAKAGVNLPACMPQGPEQTGGHALQLRTLLNGQKCLKNQ